MPLSYSIIKKQRVDSQCESFEIPVIPTEGLNSSQGDSEEKNIEVNKRYVEIIQQAESKASSIIKKAQGQALSIRSIAEEEGNKKGFEKGFEQGYKKAMEETVEIKENAKALLYSAHTESRRYLKGLEEEIIELSCFIAESIVHFSIDRRDENIVEMVKNALKHGEERKQIIIRCPPESILFLQANLYQFTNICPNATFTLLEDKERQNNDCIIETEEQVIDLNIKKQLENIAGTLLEKGEDGE